MGNHVAVLVDGDNISADHAAVILELAQRHGTADIVRVYGNAACNSGWHDALNYRMIHSGTGKNATDILLAIDAIEFAQTRSLQTFVIASSDGDFMHLAQRLREHGLTVIGTGEAKAPQGFRAACTSFNELGPVLQSTSKCTRVAHKNDISKFDAKIQTVIAEHSKNGLGIRISLLSQQMKHQHRTKISTYPEKNWRTYLKDRPTLYDLDPRGPEAMVRYKRDAFFSTG